MRRVVTQQNLEIHNPLLKGVEGILNILNGPDENEQIGLDVVERKIMRGGPDSYDVMDMNGGLVDNCIGVSQDATLSVKNFAASTTTGLAMLVRQASQQP